MQLTTNSEVDVAHGKMSYRWLAVVAAAAAVALWLGVSPVLLLFFAMCPLMMFFMMRGMGGMGGGGDAADRPNEHERLPHDGGADRSRG